MLQIQILKILILESCGREERKEMSFSQIGIAVNTLEDRDSPNEWFNELYNNNETECN